MYTRIRRTTVISKKRVERGKKDAALRRINVKGLSCQTLKYQHGPFEVYLLKNQEYILEMTGIALGSNFRL